MGWVRLVPKTKQKTIDYTIKDNNKKEFEQLSLEKCCEKRFILRMCLKEERVAQFLKSTAVHSNLGPASDRVRQFIPSWVQCLTE